MYAVPFRAHLITEEQMRKLAILAASAALSATLAGSPAADASAPLLGGSCGAVVHLNCSYYRGGTRYNCAVWAVGTCWLGNGRAVR